MEDWIIISLGIGAIFGVYNIVTKSYSDKLPSNVIVMLIGLGIFIAGLVFLATQKAPLTQVNDATPLLWIIFVSAVIWFIGTFLQVSVFANPKTQFGPAVVLMTVGSILACTIIGLLFFGDKLSAKQALGMALAIAGTILLSL